MKKRNEKSTLGILVRECSNKSMKRSKVHSKKNILGERTPMWKKLVIQSCVEKKKEKLRKMDKMRKERK